MLWTVCRREKERENEREREKDDARLLTVACLLTYRSSVLVGSSIGSSLSGSRGFDIARSGSLINAQTSVTSPFVNRTQLHWLHKICSTLAGQLKICSKLAGQPRLLVDLPILIPCSRWFSYDYRIDRSVLATSKSYSFYKFWKSKCCTPRC